MRELISAEQIEGGLDRMAAFVRGGGYRPPLVVVGVLTGCLPLMADLIRRLDMPLRLAMVHASRYRGPRHERGELRVSDRLLPDLRGAHVVVIDDVLTTGRTLLRVGEQLRRRQPASLRSAVLLKKRAVTPALFAPDFVGMEIPDVPVVGYGLDQNDLYRNLPCVATLDPDEAG